MRDAFAVLFFVSVGMLFDPAIVVEAPLALLATVLIIMVGKSVAAYLVVRLFGHSRSAALMITASLAQIGEFSFILANRGLRLGCCRRRAATSFSPAPSSAFSLNPLLFAALDILRGARREKALADAAAAAEAAEEEEERRCASRSARPASRTMWC